MPEPASLDLGRCSRARRRHKRLSLRDLADQTGVSFNTLSRVERGHVPDLGTSAASPSGSGCPPRSSSSQTTTPSTPAVIARHLSADRRLEPEAAAKIAEMVEEMYHAAPVSGPRVAVHLRSAKTFTPAAGAALADILREMQSNLTDRRQ